MTNKSDAADKETGRVEAFSDGVFAIAITLLVLDMHVPPINDSPDAPGLIAQMLNDWPIYGALVTSFLFVLIMWINHHRLFTLIKRTDNNLLLLNGLLLFGVTMVPFPTKIVAQYLNHRDQLAAAIIYNGWSALIAVFFNLLWRYAAHKNRLMGQSADPDLINAISRQYLFGPFLYLIALAVAFVSVYLSLLITFALAIFFALPSRITRAIDQQANELLVE